MEASANRATTPGKSGSYLGAQFRRLRIWRGSPKAITAMASKLARLIYEFCAVGKNTWTGARLTMKSAIDNSRFSSSPKNRLNRLRCQG